MKNKRISLVLLSLALVAVLAGTAIFSSFAGLLGDVNEDGKVNSTDARRILRVSAKLEVFTEKEAKIADINGDNKVNSSDARLCLRMAAKLEPTVVMPEESTTQKPEPEEPSTEEPSTEPSTQPDPIVDKGEQQKNYYVKSVVKTYDDAGNETVKKLEYAVQTLSGTTADGAQHEYHRYYSRSDSAFPGKDVGILVRESLNSDGTVAANYYILNYSANQYLGMDETFVQKFMKDDSKLKLQITPVTTYSSLEGLDAEETEFDGVQYQKLTQMLSDGSVKEYYLVKQDAFFRPAVIRQYNAAGALTAETVISDFTTDPSPYVSISGMSGFVVTLENFVSNMNRVIAFMDTLGIDA